MYQRGPINSSAKRRTLSRRSSRARKRSTIVGTPIMRGSSNAYNANLQNRNSRVEAYAPPRAPPPSRRVIRSRVRENWLDHRAIALALKCAANRATALRSRRTGSHRGHRPAATPAGKGLRRGRPGAQPPLGMPVPREEVIIPCPPSAPRHLDVHASAAPDAAPLQSVQLSPGSNSRINNSFSTRTRDVAQPCVRLTLM